MNSFSIPFSGLIIFASH